MKAKITLFALISVFSASLASYAKDNTLIGSQKIVLDEFSIDTKNTVLLKNISCSKEEVKNGVVNLISFGRTDNSARRLTPTYRPLDNEAAWLIRQSECPSLLPHINGIGFHSLDEKTGDAVLYIAAFNQKKVDDKEWNSNNGIGKMRSLFQPEYDVINVIKFNAKCELKRQVLGLLDSKLICTILDVKGSVTFSVVNDK